MNQDFVVLNLGWTQLEPQHAAETVSPFMRIYYLKQGEAVLRFRDREVRMSPRHRYMVPAYTPHAYDSDTTVQLYYLFVLHRQARRNFLEDYDMPSQVRSNEATQLLFENYCHLYPQLNLPAGQSAVGDRYISYRGYLQIFRGMEEYERLQLHGMVEILLSYFLKHSQSRKMAADPRIAGVMEYVSNHMSEQISVEQLADYACLTKSYLIRTFRQMMNVTPLQYVIRKKIQLAQKMLLESDSPVSDIALAVGFRDTSYFIRQFRKHIGVTPQDYRVQLIG